MNNFTFEHNKNYIVAYYNGQYYGKFASEIEAATYIILNSPQDFIIERKVGIF